MLSVCACVLCVFILLCMWVRCISTLFFSIHLYKDLKLGCKVLWAFEMYYSILCFNNRVGTKRNELEVGRTIKDMCFAYYSVMTQMRRCQVLCLNCLNYIIFFYFEANFVK